MFLAIVYAFKKNDMDEAEPVGQILMDRCPLRRRIAGFGTTSLVLSESMFGNP